MVKYIKNIRRVNREICLIGLFHHIGGMVWWDIQVDLFIIFSVSGYKILYFNENKKAKVENDFKALF